jgi:hypothetical protein
MEENDFIFSQAMKEVIWSQSLEKLYSFNVIFYLLLSEIYLGQSNHIKWLLELQSNSVIKNSLGLAQFVRNNREFVVFELVNIDFGTEKNWKNLFAITGSWLEPSLTVVTLK